MLRFFVAFLLVVALGVSLFLVAQENFGRPVYVNLPFDLPSLTDMDTVDLGAGCMVFGLVAGLILALIVSVGTHGRARRREREIRALRSQLAEARQVAEDLSRRVQPVAESPALGELSRAEATGHATEWPVPSEEP